jgi:hypothetical protein
MAKKSNYNRLAQFSAAERNRAIKSNPGLLNGLTPTQIAELFPDYFRRGTPDIGGFRDAISKASAERTSLWQQGVNDRLRSEGSWLEKMRDKYSGGNNVSMDGGGSGNVKGSFSAAQYVKILKQAGFSHKDATLMAAVGMQESAGNIRASNDKTSRERSYGLFQININAHPFGSPEMRYAGVNSVEDLYDPAKNAKVAYYLYHKTPNGIRHWGGFTDGGYRQYLGTAQKAAASIEDTTPSTEQAKGQTPQQAGGQTTTGSAGGGGSTSGGSFKVVSGFVVPQDNSLYDTRNAQQCATLGKAFNPNIGRSGGWTVVDGDIKAGQVVATKQYNNPGGDREHAGYHTGVALTAPNQEGKFLLLEQFNGQPARTRWVDKNAYPIPGGGTTSFGLISSGGKVHSEISQEALSYGKTVAKDSEKQIIGTASGTPGITGKVEEMDSLAPVPMTPEEQLSAAMNQQGPIEGQSQTATVLGILGGAPNLMGAMQGNPMGMMMGMMGGFGGMQSATPLGLITTAMGFIMPLIGSLGAGKGAGEGIGGGSRGRKKGSVSSMPIPEIDERMLPSLRPDIGHVTRQFETGKYGDAANFGVATISSGKQDSGGKSYGEHQIASRTGTLKEFINSPEAAAYRGRFGKAKLASPQFDQIYKQIANEDPTAFAEAQRKFLSRTHYEPNLRMATALGYNTQDPRFQEALWGGSIQQRGYTKGILQNPKMLATIGQSTEDQVMSYARAKGDFMKKYPKMYANRFLPEAQAILGQDPQIPGVASVNKLDMNKYADYMKSEKARRDTMFASAPETTPTPSVSQVTSPTQIAQASAAPSFGETMRSYAKSYADNARSLKQSIGRLTGLGNMTTPGMSSISSAQDYGPTYTPGSMDISSQPAPVGSALRNVSMTNIPGAVPNTIGTNVFPTTSPVGTFPIRGAGLRDFSATVIAPSAMVPQRSIFPDTSPVRGSMMQAPGPAPSSDAMHTTNMTAMAAAVASSTESQGRSLPMMQQVSHVTNENHDSNMKMIQSPADNPSIYRAFSRINSGEDLPGDMNIRKIMG